MLPHLPLILALDLGPIIQVIFFLVILASGVAKMFRESKEVQRRADQQRPRPRPRPQPLDDDVRLEPVDAGAARQRPQENIRSEVEEFLRRVGEEDREQRPARQQPRPQQRQRPRQPQIELIEDDSGFDVDNRPRQSHRKQRPLSQPDSRPEPARVHQESVAEHVSEHMKQGEFAERASHLGEVVAHSDERLEARLHQKFDHGLGSLSARREAREAADLATKSAQASPTALADSLVELLSTPQGVQQAVILSEVLNRPADRW